MADWQALQGFVAIVLDSRTVLLGLFTFPLLSWIKSRYRKRLINLPPGPMAWPFIGCSPQLLFITLKTGNILDLFVHLRAKYGPVCNVPLPFGMNVVLVSGYKGVNEVFTSLKFDQRPPFPRMNNPIDLLNGAVLRSFGVGKRSFEDQIQIATESEYLMKEISSVQGKPFDPTHLLSNAVSNIICSVVFEKRFEYDDPEFRQWLHSFDEIVDNPAFNVFIVAAPRLVAYLTMIPFFPKGAMQAVLSIRRKIQEIVNKHRETFDSENMRDYIDVYLNDMQVKKEKGLHTHFSDVELLAVVKDFFGAGTETTSTTLRWALLYMLKYPDVQKRVHEEIDSVVGRDRLPKLSDKTNLPYTVAVIEEIQRFLASYFCLFRDTLVKM
ncbi:cytochrome P450 2C11-like [Amphiura filiformis]|uniref:cytochrome P450 2C11-like n=1 Tax=Amphiura filiformis TaxID=82378 RepID=UPI003B2243B9